VAAQQTKDAPSSTTSRGVLSTTCRGCRCRLATGEVIQVAPSQLAAWATLGWIWLPLSVSQHLGLTRRIWLWLAHFNYPNCGSGLLAAIAIIAFISHRIASYVLSMLCAHDVDDLATRSDGHLAQDAAHCVLRFVLAARSLTIPKKEKLKRFRDCYGLDFGVIKDISLGNLLRG